MYHLRTRYFYFANSYFRELQIGRLRLNRISNRIGRSVINNKLQMKQIFGLCYQQIFYEALQRKRYGHCKILSGTVWI